MSWYWCPRAREFLTESDAACRMHELRRFPVFGWFRNLLITTRSTKWLLLDQLRQNWHVFFSHKHNIPNYECHWVLFRTLYSVMRIKRHHPLLTWTVSRKREQIGDLDTDSNRRSCRALCIWKYCKWYALFNLQWFILEKNIPYILYLRPLTIRPSTKNHLCFYRDIVIL